MIQAYVSELEYLIGERQKVDNTGEIRRLDDAIKKLKRKIYNECSHNWEVETRGCDSLDYKCTTCGLYYVHLDFKTQSTEVHSASVDEK
jgi:hypothetical protein